MVRTHESGGQYLRTNRSVRVPLRMACSNRDVRVRNPQEIVAHTCLDRVEVLAHQATHVGRRTNKLTAVSGSEEAGESWLLWSVRRVQRYEPALIAEQVGCESKQFAGEVIVDVVENTDGDNEVCPLGKPLSQPCLPDRADEEARSVSEPRSQACRRLRDVRGVRIEARVPAARQVVGDLARAAADVDYHRSGIRSDDLSVDPFDGSSTADEVLCGSIRWRTQKEAANTIVAFHLAAV